MTEDFARELSGAFMAYVQENPNTASLEPAQLRSDMLEYMRSGSYEIFLAQNAQDPMYASYAEQFNSERFYHSLNELEGMWVKEFGADIVEAAPIEAPDLDPDFDIDDSTSFT